MIMRMMKNNNNETVMVIGIDHGYGNMKTATRCFPSGVARYDKEPIFQNNLLVYNGMYYQIGEEHKEFCAEKTQDEDYYVLTLAAIARELDGKGMNRAKVHIAAGLPFTWVATQKEDFQKYLLQNENVDFIFRNKEYHIEFAGADIYPQGFAAAFYRLQDFKGINMLGMSVELPTEPGKKVTVMDVFFSNAQGKFYALFLVIFAVMFATADIKSGYIKNIGGQVSQRGMLIVSRAVALALFTAITFAGIFVFQAVANMLAFKCVMWGNWKEIIPYFLTELTLHYAFVLICMAIAVIIKNNVISMTLSVCLTMNIMSIVYAFIDYVVNRKGFHNFSIYKYTVTGRMAMLPMNAGRDDVVGSMCVAAVFIIIMLSLSSYIFQKRDI